MSANLKLVPRAERLLEGKITADMTDSQTTVTVDNPPLITALPSCLEIDPDSSTYRELCRVINVSGLTITLERGLNNGGTGFTHTNNTPYKFKFTSRHWETVATALESGYLFEDASYGFAKVSTSSFKITAAGVDRTDTYTTGRRVRINGTIVALVSSSSYSNPDTTVVINAATVPTTITSIELAITTKGTTPELVDLTTAQTLTNKVLSTGSKLDANADPNFTYNSLYRQAIINGNFDVWQRGTSLAGGTGGNTAVYAADRWNTYNGSATSTFSQQDGTGVPGSRYSIRCQRNNGQTATTTTNLATALETINSIKFRGVKITLSFWAKCGANYSPASSALIASIVTGKGTDQNIYAGFTDLTDAIKETKTLTTSWQKFTLTTTNVIASDITQIGVLFNCTPVGTAGANDWFEIAQVQLCAGDVALPFMPKSFEEELNACQRYYEKSYSYGTALATNFAISSGDSLSASIAGGCMFQKESAANTNRKYNFYPFKVQKRTTPGTLRYWDLAGNLTKCNTVDASGAYSANNVFETFQAITATNNLVVFHNASNSAGWAIHWDYDCEL